MNEKLRAEILQAMGPRYCWSIDTMPVRLAAYMAADVAFLGCVQYHEDLAEKWQKAAQQLERAGDREGARTHSATAQWHRNAVAEFRRMRAELVDERVVLQVAG